MQKNFGLHKQTLNILRKTKSQKGFITKQTLKSGISYRRSISSFILMNMPFTQTDPENSVVKGTISVIYSFRWHNKLHPDIQHTTEPWKQDQSLALLKIYQQLGSKWAKVIHRLCEAGFKRRSENTIKNHFHLLVKNSVKNLNTYVQDYNRNIRLMKPSDERKKTYCYQKTYSIQKMVMKKIQKNEQNFLVQQQFTNEKSRKQIIQKQKNHFSINPIYQKNNKFQSSSQQNEENQHEKQYTNDNKDKKKSCKINQINLFQQTNQNQIENSQKNQSEKKQKISLQASHTSYLKPIDQKSINRFWLWSNDKSQGRLKIMSELDNNQLKRIRNIFIQFIKYPSNFNSEEVKNLIKEIAKFTKGCKKINKNQRNRVLKERKYKPKYHIQKQARRIFEKITAEYFQNNKKEWMKIKQNVISKLKFFIGKFFTKKQQFDEEINPQNFLQKKQEKKIILSILQQFQIKKQQEFEKEKKFTPKEQTYKNKISIEAQGHQDVVTTKQKKTKQIKKTTNQLQKIKPKSIKQRPKQTVKQILRSSNDNKQLQDKFRKQQKILNIQNHPIDLDIVKIQAKPIQKKPQDSPFKILVKPQLEQNNLERESSQYSLGSKKSIRPNIVIIKQQNNQNLCPLIQKNQKGSFSQLLKDFPNSLVNSLQLFKEYSRSMFPVAKSGLQIGSEKNSNARLSNSFNSNFNCPENGIKSSFKIVNESQQYLKSNSILNKKNSISFNMIERQKSNFESMQILARSFENSLQPKILPNQLPLCRQNENHLFSNQFFQNIRNVEEQNSNLLWKDSNPFNAYQFLKEDYSMHSIHSNRSFVPFNPFSSQPIDFQIPQKLIQTVKNPNFPIKNYNNYSLNYQHIKSSEQSKIFEFDKKFGFNSAILPEVDLLSQQKNQSNRSRQRQNQNFSNMFRSQKIPTPNESYGLNKVSKILSVSCNYSSNQSRKIESLHNLQSQKCLIKLPENKQLWNQTKNFKRFNGI